MMSRALELLTGGHCFTGLRWVWWFPWGFPWVWVWAGYGDCDESPRACGNSAGIFDWVEIKQECVKYHVINAIVDVWISQNKVELWICIMALFEFFSALSLQNRPTLHYSISVYRENNAYLNIYLYMINSTKYVSNKRRRLWGISMEDFGVLWVWGFRGDSHGILLWIWDGMGIKIQSPWQPCCFICRSRRRAYASRALTRWQHFYVKWPPSWKCDFKSKICLASGCVFTWRTITPNVIPMQFDRGFFGGRPKKKEKKQNKNNKMSSDMRLAPDPKIS